MIRQMKNILNVIYYKSLKLPLQITFLHKISDKTQQKQIRDVLSLKNPFKISVII